MTIKYRPDIDGLRAIAVAAVVAFHAYPATIRGGFVGVDVFFVISGYLISSIIFQNLDQGTFSFTDFFARRIKRIFPALILVILSSYIYAYFYLFPVDMAQLGKHIAGGATFISNFTLWQEAGYFDVSTETKPLLHLWSLAIEEQFYIIWPIVIFFSWNKKSLVLPLLFSSISISFILNVYYLNKEPSMVFYLPFFRFWEILAGSLLSYLDRNKAKLPLSSDMRASIGAILLLLGIGVLSHKILFPGWWALLPVMGTFLIISAGPEAYLNSKILANKKVIALGLISYPLYLWHWPILAFLRIWEGGKATTLARSLAVVISILLAWITFEFFEKPIRLKSWDHKTAFFSLGMFLLGALGIGTNMYGGLPGRWPKEIVEYAAITKPFEYFGYLEKTRESICHSTKEVEKNKVEDRCIDKIRPLVFLMGDSFSAALYPGLKANQKVHKFGIAQYTNGNAPPFLNLKESRIADTMEPVSDINARNLLVIEKYKPETVILSWSYNQKNSLPYAKTIEAFKLTVSGILAKSPDSKIFIIGPVPLWNRSLLHNYLRYWTTYGFEMPTYSNFGLETGFKTMDQKMKRSTFGVRTKYISAADILCNKDGCLTRTGPYPQDLTAVDFGHLTPNGSTYLINKIIHLIVPQE